MVLTVNGTTRSERAGGLDNGEVNRFTTRPGEYRHDLHTIEDVIANIAEKAYQRGEWVSSIELDGVDTLIAMVVEKLQENILNVSATVDALASLGFFAAADLEDLTSWVNGVKRDNFDSSDMSDLAYKTAASVWVPAQTFEQLEAAYERKDYRTAFAGFKKLAEQGHAPAQFNLGFMYDNGEGVPKDSQQAVVWYRKAAEQGDVHAQNNLGFMYGNGQGVPKDEQQAAAWYRKAAEQGYAGAQNNLGVMYYMGEGVPKDDHPGTGHRRGDSGGCAAGPPDAV
jgi:TPR repeat protein